MTVGVNAADFQRMLDRGETITALIEAGYPLYFNAPIGMELLTLIANADARRDVEALTSAAPAVVAHSPLDFI